MSIQSEADPAALKRAARVVRLTLDAVEAHVRPGVTTADLDAVGEAVARGLEVARAGRRVSDIGRAVDAEGRRRGFHVAQGLDGHGIGRTIHEPPAVPNVYVPWQRDLLTDGLVLTIEPMVCAGAGATLHDEDGWTVRTRDGSLAAHHEHTLVITRARPLLLTTA